MNPKKKVDTNSIRSKSRSNTLLVSWGVNKIHAKINFKKQIILVMSLMSKDEYTKPETSIIAWNKVLHDKGGTNTRTDWLLRFSTEVLIGVGMSGKI